MAKSGPKRKYEIDKSELEEMFQRRPAKDIAAHYGCGETLIWNRLDEYGIPRVRRKYKPRTDAHRKALGGAVRSVQHSQGAVDVEAHGLQGAAGMRVSWRGADRRQRDRRAGSQTCAERHMSSTCCDGCSATAGSAGTRLSTLGSRLTRGAAAAPAATWRCRWGRCTLNGGHALRRYAAPAA